MREKLLQQVKEIVAGARSREETLLAICCAIQQGIPRCDWVGFYLVDPQHPRELVLGPFVGEPTEHVRIPFGRGVCGRAAATGETVVVPDVRAEANYLSCSPKVRSEIVIPLRAASGVVGELDIDSHAPAAFGEEERRDLEEVCRIAECLFA
jgi:L-methionine (R)-S-oxide reductase